MLPNWIFFCCMFLPADSSYDLLNSCTIWNHCIFKHHSYPRTNIKSFRWPVRFLHILHSQAREYCEHLFLKNFDSEAFCSMNKNNVSKIHYPNSTQNWPKSHHSIQRLSFFYVGFLNKKCIYHYYCKGTCNPTYMLQIK